MKSRFLKTSFSGKNKTTLLKGIYFPEKPCLRRGEVSVPLLFSRPSRLIRFSLGPPSARKRLTLRVGHVVVESQVPVRVHPAVRADHGAVLQPPLLPVLPANGLVLEVPLRALVRLDVVLRVRCRVPSSVDFRRHRSENGELETNSSLDYDVAVAKRRNVENVAGRSERITTVRV